MRESIEPLIVERAPWLARQGLWPRAARGVLDQILGYDEVVSLAETLKDKSAPGIMNTVADRLAKDVHVTGLENMPKTGAALVVANHPTGIGDGIMLWHALRQLRPDMFFYANSDILRILPQMGDLIAPVEWRHEKRSHTKARETMTYTRAAFDAGRLGVIFPSGRLAKRRGLTLHERPWMGSAATLARKFDLPVIPINIQARNSALFYMFDYLHPTLRDITLFHETLNKDRQFFKITVGRPVSASELSSNAEDATAYIKRVTLQAGDPQLHRSGALRPSYWRRISPKPRRLT